MNIRKEVLDRIINDPNLMKDEWHVSMFAPLHRMMNFDQKNPHHTMSLMDHSIDVASRVPRIYQITRTAALYHDCGKVDTAKFVLNKGHAVYHGHDKVGADLARVDLDGVLHPQIIDDVCLLISLHMRPLGYINQPFGDKGVRRLIKKAQGNMVDIDDLMMLNEADIMAHNPDQIADSLIGHQKLKDHINLVRK